jgi:hypothetical protein
MGDQNSRVAGRPTWIGARDLEALRQQWRAVGRDIWNEGTRTGRRVLATTESALEALGRNQMEAEAARLEAVRKVGRLPADVVRTGQQIARRGTSSDPGPADLLEEFAVGRGPETRVLGPMSSISADYARAPSVQGHLRNALADWRKRDGGRGQYTNYDADFGPTQLLLDLEAANGATNVIGSARLDAERHGDRIDWSATNKMGRNSMFYGNPLSSLGIAGVPDRARPGRFGSTRQVLQFSTDLDGNPIGRPSGVR